MFCALLVSCVLCSSSANAQSTLFTSAGRPSNIDALQDAAFMQIDAHYFRDWEPEHLRSFSLPDFQLPGGKRVTLSLESFPLLTRDAKLVMVSDKGEITYKPRKHVLLRGTIKGEPNSHVYLALWEHYGAGYIVREIDGKRHRYLVSPTGSDIYSSQTLIVYEHTGAKRPKWECGLETADLMREEDERESGDPKGGDNDGGNNEGGNHEGQHDDTPLAPDPDRSFMQQAKGGGNSTQSTTPMVLTQALELSYNFFTNRGGGNSDQAFEYAFLITGAESDIYFRDVRTSVMVSNARCWIATDPYTGSSSDAQLDQFRTHYIANMQGTARNTAHLYSAHNYGGIAWLDVLCESVSNGYGYAFSGLLGGYVYPNDGFYWDPHVISHEYGHNVGSRHTQSCNYNPPIDSCVAAEQGSCYGSWQIHEVLGTIMSYCDASELYFHPRTKSLLRSYVEASCATSPSHPIANAGADVTLCGPQGVQIGSSANGGTAPLTYWWRPSTGLSDPTIASPVASPTTSRQYIVRVTDANDLRTYDTVYVTVNPGVSLGPSPDKMICKGSGVKIGQAASGSAMPFMYQWSPTNGLDDPNASQPTANPANTTTYVQTVTDQNGCIKRDTIVVTVNTQPSIALANPPGICPGADIEIGAEATGGTGPYNYAWTPSTGLSSTSVAKPVASPFATTKYYVTVTDAVGCQRRDSVTVTIGSSLRANAGADVATCKGSTVLLGDNITGGVAPFTITWSPKAGLSDTTVLRPTLTVTTDATYFVSVTDSKGCTSRDTVIIMASEGPKLTGLQKDAIMCKGSPVAIGIAATGGQGPYTYLWSPSIGLSSSLVATPEAKPTKNTTYTVTVTDLFGCKFTDSVRVVVGEGVKFTLGADKNVCTGQSVVLAPQSPLTATANYTWRDLNTNANLGSAKELTLTPNVAGRYELLVTDGDCTGRDTIEVKLVPAATASIAGVLEFCQYDSTLLSAGEGFSKYRWSNGSTSSSILVKAAGNYWCAVENAGGCTDTAYITVLQKPAPQAAITVNDDTLTAAPAKTYQWHVNNAAIQGATAQSYIVRANGTYHVEVSNDEGCTARSATVNKIISGIRDVTEVKPRVVPNPTTGIITVRAPEASSIKRIYLTTMLGSEINLANIREFSGSNIELDLRSLASGSYLLHIITDSGEHVERIVKQ
ncbi:MAG TPA: M12 family metallo-peptidase [Candidatus Kapabacteria bacterium]|nr:M12 family metallo-peptidase [Candidatus Kapabacteria bacterium]